MQRSKGAHIFLVQRTPALSAQPTSSSQPAQPKMLTFYQALASGFKRIANGRALSEPSICFLIWEISVPAFRASGAGSLHIPKCYRKGMEVIPKNALQIPKEYILPKPFRCWKGLPQALGSPCAPAVHTDSDDSPKPSSLNCEDQNCIIKKQ